MLFFKNRWIFEVWPSAQDAGAVGGGTSLLYKVPGRRVGQWRVDLVGGFAAQPAELDSMKSRGIWSMF